MIYIKDYEKIPRKEEPMPFEKLTKIKGDHTRHIEQLWDEIKKLKERVCLLETKKENRHE